MLTFIQSCATESHLQAFLQKHYGLELLLLLDEFGKTGRDNGIEDTYNAILVNRPRRETFGIFCRLLIRQGSITEIESNTKKSKKVLRLSETTQAQLRVALFSLDGNAQRSLSQL